MESKGLCKHRKWNETDAKGCAKRIIQDPKGSKRLAKWRQGDAPVEVSKPPYQKDRQPPEKLLLFRALKTMGGTENDPEYFIL